LRLDAAPSYGGRQLRDAQIFPQPTAVRKQVAFWEVVFSVYPSTSVLIHDAVDPTIVIDLLDHVALKTPKNSIDRTNRLYLDRYRKAIQRFATEGEKALQYGPIEKRILQVYGKSKDGLARLARGEITLRTQAGLSDEFVGASVRAQVYLPKFEQIFQSYGLPTKLTRIAFVESMFRHEAVSKVGASGMWQFMRSTARKFMFVTSLVDERNAPIKAARGAAQLLSENFAELRAWPLAVTAYNHGRDGMARAVAQLGTRDMGAIIARYKSPSFGFASRNFYSEMLAAANVYDKIQRTGLLATVPAPPKVEQVILEKPMSVQQILKNTSLTEALLRAHNPCINDAAYGSMRDTPLPAFYEITIPAALMPIVTAELRQPKSPRIARR
jgi:membrane-bound lytic murein transglycosylase D